MAKLMGLLKSGLITGTVVAGLTGCERATDDNANVSIQIPSAQKLQRLSGSSSNELKLKHLVINITGPGMGAPTYFMWDGCGDCSNPTPEPSDVQLEVPSGSSRLIQVMAVYDNLTAKKTIFYYGDITENLNGNASVKVPLQPATDEMDLASGQISGRILDTANSGPSGIVNIKYQPPGDKPALLIEKNNIQSGWFSFFALSGINLRYELENGRDLFGKAIDLRSDLLKPSKHMAKFFVPIHSRQENGQLRQSEEAEISVLGYFGAPELVSDKFVCHNITDGETTNNWMKYDAVTTPLSFSILSESAAPPTNLFNRSTPPTTVTLQGGRSETETDCTGLIGDSANIIFRRFLFLRKENLNNGREGLPGFSVPYAGLEAGTGLAYGSSQIIKATNDQGALRLAGRLLPGISSQIKGIRVFNIPVANGSDFHMDRVPCQVLEKSGNELNAYKVGEANVEALGLFQVLTQVGFTTLTQSSALALCPVGLSGQTLPQGSLIKGYQLLGGGSGGSNTPYLRFEFNGGVQRDMMTRVLPYGRCIPVKLKAYVNNGGSTSAPYALTTAFSATTLVSSLGSFYQDSSCGATLTSVSISPGQSESAEFSFYADTRGESSQLLMANMMGPSLNYDSESNRIAVEDFELRFNSYGQSSFSMTMGSCAPMSANLYLGGAPYNGPMPYLYMYLNTVSGVTYYSDMTCNNTGGTSVNLNSAGIHSFAVQVAATGVFTISTTVAPTGVTVSPATIQVGN